MHKCLTCGNDTEKLFCSSRCRTRGTKAAWVERYFRKEAKAQEWNERFQHEKVVAESGR